MTEDARQAAHHVLVAISSVVPPDHFPGPCRIRGQVIHLWHGSLPIGTSVELTRLVVTRGQEPQTAGDWSDWDTVSGARYIDAFLVGSGSYQSLAGGGAMFLRSLPAGVKSDADPVASAATLALGSSLVGAGCFPFSLLAIVFSLQSFSRARRSGRRVPGRAVFALLLSLAVLGAGTLLTILMTVYSKERRATAKTIAMRLDRTRDEKLLKPETACDLVREQAIAGTFGAVGSSPSVTCRGPFVELDDRATFEHVEIGTLDGRDDVAACFALNKRWFLAGIVTSGVPCPSFNLPESAASDDAARTAEEKSIRTNLAEVFDRADVDALTNRLVAVRDKLKSTPHADRPCEHLDLATELKPATVDLALLDRDPAAVDNWPFLTSESVRNALNGGSSVHDRASAVATIRRRGGPYLVVYDSTRRALPVIRKKKGTLGDDYTYLGGGFAGWMTVADLRTGESLCAGKLVFENSTTINYRKNGLSAEENRVRASVMDDLEDQFKTQATNVIRKLSDGKLRLGYKLLE